MIELVLVALAGAAGARQVFGLLVRQVHSIVRVDGRDTQLRPRGAGGGWELAYEGAWIPVYPLRECLGLPTEPGALAAVSGGSAARILGLKLPAGPDGAPAFAGVAVDEVVDIASYPLTEIQPIPAWLVPRLPRLAVWGAIPAARNEVLLLLDGVALARQSALA